MTQALKPKIENDRNTAKRYKMQKAARTERRDIMAAQALLVWAVSGLLVAMGIDYSLGFVVMDYLAPTVGEYQIGGYVLALLFPTALVVMHLLIDADESGRIEKGLNVAAFIALIAFVIGAGTMLSNVVSEGSFELGQSSAQSDQVILGQDLGLGDSEPTGAQTFYERHVAGWPPLLFFGAISLALILTFFVGHRALKKAMECLEFLKTTTDRLKAVKEYNKKLDQLVRDHRRKYGVWKTAKIGDPDDKIHAYCLELSTLAQRHLQTAQRGFKLRKLGRHEEADTLDRLGGGFHGTSANIENDELAEADFEAVKASISYAAIRTIMESPQA